MNLILNINEALSAIRENLLRAVFTVSIIAIGIFSLIGILTTVEGIKNSIENNLSSIGSNVFEIEEKGAFNRHSYGKRPDKVYPAITLKQAMAFRDRYDFPAYTSISTSATSIATVKYNSEETNPNVGVVGTDEHYLNCESLKLNRGRNFSRHEVENGADVAIIGYEVYSLLFGEERVLGERISVFGRKYKVIGVLEDKGAFFGGAGGSRTVVLPLRNVRELPLNRELKYNIKTLVADAKDIPPAIDQAKAIMKRVRQDESRTEDSFQIERSNAMLRSIDQISSLLKIVGVAISIVTLIGASIGLINIMLVSVTERTREIGVRKALGATPQQIGVQFLIESIVICVLGALFGVLLGSLIGNVISFSMGSPGFYFPWGWTIISLVSCIVVGVAGGLYPSIKAARLDPIDSLRFE